MKNFVLTLTFVACLSHAFAQSVQWTRSAGGGSRDEAYGTAATQGGHVYITGMCADTAVFGSTTFIPTQGADGFLADYDASGGLSFLFPFTGAGTQSGHQVATDLNSQIYVVGEFETEITAGGVTLYSAGGYDLFVASLDANGTMNWIVRAGGPGNEEVNSVKADANGNVYITGSFENTAGFGPINVTSAGGTDIFISKISPTSNFDWVTTAGGPADDIGRAIAVPPTGNCFITGYFEGIADFGVTSFSSNGGSKDVFLCEVSPSGTIVSAVKAGGPGDDASYDIALDNSGNCYLTGKFRDSAIFGPYVLNSAGVDDIFVMKAGLNGIVYWATAVGGTLEDKGYGIAVSSAGVYVTGSFEDAFQMGPQALVSSGGRDVFASRFDPATGNCTWAMQAGGPGYDRGYNIAALSSGVWFTGVFEQSLQFGSQQFTSQGMTDLFLCKIGVPTGLDQGPGAQSVSVVAYPDPVSDILAFHGLQSGDLVECYDSKGTRCGAKSVAPAAESFFMDVRELPDGLYLIRVTHPNRQQDSMRVMVCKASK